MLIEILIHLPAFYSLSRVQAEYARSIGTLSIKAQSVGMAYGYYAQLCAWNTSSGNLNWMEGFGMMGVNSTDDPLTISFVDNGVWGNLIHSLYMLSVGCRL